MATKRALLAVFFMVTLIFTVSQSYAAEGRTSKAYVFELDFERAMVDFSYSQRQHSLAVQIGDKAAADHFENKNIVHSTEIGNLLKPYYGQTTGYLFSNLFVAHSAANLAYTQATIKKNAVSVKQAEKRINDSADDIMVFLAELSPKNLSNETLRPHFSAYISSQMQQIKMLEEEKIQKEDEAWEYLLIKSSKLGDAIAKGIVKEFPEKF